jgi:hypothetical protein
MKFYSSTDIKKLLKMPEDFVNKQTMVFFENQSSVYSTNASHCLILFHLLMAFD